MSAAAQLPFPDAERDVDEVVGTAELESSDESPRVLVIEDESLVARHIARSLTKNGFDVVGRATRGEDAIEMARQLQPALIVADIRLRGEMDGIEATSRIQREMDVAVVFLTAYSDRATMDRVVATEAAGYVVKPFNEAGLCCAVEIALRRFRSERAIRDESMRDELTGVGNRRALRTIGALRLARARQERRSVALFFFDLDGLKRVNDELGHERGDALLRSAADALAATFRKGDVVARYGGDEFVVMATDVTPASAPSLLYRLALRLEQSKVGRGDAGIELSIGVAYTDEHPEASLDELLAHADAAMYADKKRRRPG